MIKNLMVEIIINNTESNKVFKEKIYINPEPLFVYPEELALHIDPSNSDILIEGFYDELLKYSYSASKIIMGILDSLMINVNHEIINALKRMYVICHVKYSFLSKEYAGSMSKVSKSKSLGDFTVSYSATRDSKTVSTSLDDAKRCIDEIMEKLRSISSASDGAASVFLLKEICAKTFFGGSRLWDLYNPVQHTYVAGRKVLQDNGQVYKGGPYVRVYHNKPIVFYPK